MRLKNWLFAVAAISLGLIVTIGCLNYLIDPLQHYRKATWYRTCFCEDARYLNPGLARHFDYDTIVIGTSMSDNFVPSYIDRTLKVRSLKLSMQGASAYEENIMMETAIRTGKVKNVILGLDVFSFMGDARRLYYGKGSMPFYLYDESPFNDYKYLLSIDTLVNQSRHSLAANLFKRNEKLDINMAYNWNRYFTFSKENAFKDWRKKNLIKKRMRGITGLRSLKGASI